MVSRKKKPDPAKLMETYELYLTAPLGFEERRIEEQAAYLRPTIARRSGIARRRKKHLVLPLRRHPPYNSYASKFAHGDLLDGHFRGPR